MLGYLYFNDEKNKIPTFSGDLIKASLSIGMIMGQLCFGIFGDALGRHRIYGKELMFTIFGTFMVILMPWKNFSHSDVLGWMSVFRVVTGFGTGGGRTQCPAAAMVIADSDRLPYDILLVCRTQPNGLSSKACPHRLLIHRPRRHVVWRRVSDPPGRVQVLDQRKTLSPPMGLETVVWYWTCTIDSDSLLSIDDARKQTIRAM